MTSPLAEPPGTIPDGVRIEGECPAANRLMWVLLEEENFLRRKDLIPGSWEVLRKLWYLGSIVRMMIAHDMS